MKNASAVRWAPGWLKIFARATAVLLLAATLAIACESAGGDAFATALVILLLSLAWAVALCVAKRTAIVLPLAVAPWMLFTAVIGLLRHWPRC
jgi:hypothetical protein